MMSFCVDKDGMQQSLTTEEFEKLMGVKFSEQLQFASESLKRKIQRKTEKLYRKGELSRQQLWFGAYYKKEMSAPGIPDVVIRYVDPVLGWGVFANRDFKKMEFIAEYTGMLRRSKWRDRKNAYCFEYTLAGGVKTPYTIDAQDQGGISRYVNHSSSPNLLSALATMDWVSHVVLIASEPIQKGEQLCYDYGSDYWSRRETPLKITSC